MDSGINNNTVEWKRTEEDQHNEVLYMTIALQDKL